MAPFHDGEMSERLKEPVLKTGDAQASVGSNPTLSATSFIQLQKYPRGRRGSPAKGVGWIKPARGFKSLLPRHMNTTRISNFFAEIRVVSYAENLDLLGFSAFLYFHAVFVK